MRLLDKMSPTITSMIRADHSHVLMIFHRYHAASAPRVREGLVKSACLALEIHAQLEEEIFYPALRAVLLENPVLAESESEHDEMRRLISKLRLLSPTDAVYDLTFMELMRDVMHHVADEETVLLPEAEGLLPDRIHELGAQMTRRRLELLGPRAGEMAANTTKAVSTSKMLLLAGAALAAGTLVTRHALASRR
jgi:hemerythrin superfamily protein